MTPLEKPLQEILSAAEQFLDDGEYEKVMVQANRLITVSSLWIASPKGITAGVALRLATSDLGLASQSDGKVDIAQKDHFSRLLRRLRETIGGSATPPMSTWSALAEFKATFWERSRGLVEGRSYTKDEPVIEAALRWATATLSSSSGPDSKSETIPLSGFANEADWVVRSFQGSPKQVQKYALFQVLSWCAGIVNWRESELPEGKPWREIDPDLGTLVDRSIKLLSEQEADEAGLDVLIQDAARKWRVDFDLNFDYFVAAQLERKVDTSRKEPTVEADRPQRGGRARK